MMSYIDELDIKKCRCNVFISKDNVCECGRTREEHDGYALKKSNIQQWDSKYCTTDDGKTDAYGNISFSGKHDVTSKFVRASHLTEPETIMRLLFAERQWNLDTPRLVISVIGGTKLKLDPKLIKTFCHGLIHMANRTSNSCWIITGGTNVGITKWIGQATKKTNESSNFSKEKITLLGIANWCTTYGNESLIRKKNETIFEYASKIG